MADDATLCKHCKPMEAMIYQERLQVTSNLEQQFARVWTQCQQCQGSLHQPVLCTRYERRTHAIYSPAKVFGLTTQLNGWQS